MEDQRSLKSKVDAAIKRADKDVIAERTFYDDVSGRLFVTIFKGPRKTEFVLSTRQLDNGKSLENQIDQTVKDAVARLARTPIG
jgi:hypothetical protein